MPTCTFFGHKECPTTILPSIRTELIDLIENRDIQQFYVGNSGTFDHMVRDVLRELCTVYSKIQYAVILAYLPTNSIMEIDHEDTLIPDGIEFVPRKYAIDWRNRWMLQRSEYVIAYVVHPFGGAAKFMNMAVRKGKYVVNLAHKSDGLVDR